uniref:Putative secreted protein n=1 Tax=Panstrongylus lignarius TaxID=156445 RepID=A0A224XWS9_9HEMI
MIPAVFLSGLCSSTISWIVSPTNTCDCEMDSNAMCSEPAVIVCGLTSTYSPKLMPMINSATSATSCVGTSVTAFCPDGISVTGRYPSLYPDIVDVICTLSLSLRVVPATLVSGFLTSKSMPSFS